MHAGGGLPTPYLAAGGVAAAAIVGIGLAGAKPDQAASSSPQSSGSAAPKSSGGGFCSISHVIGGFTAASSN